MTTETSTPTGRFRASAARAPARLGVFAVEPDAAQLTWGRLGPGPVTFSGAGPDVRVEADGGPGAVELAGLRPGRDYRVRVHGAGVPSAGEVRFTTTTPPPGPELARLATLSDLHLGTEGFGLFGTMQGSPTPAEEHPERCATAALDEAVAWGAERIVAKGDLTSRGLPSEWAQLGALVERCPVPFDAIPGNHEVRVDRGMEPEDGFAAIGLRWPDPVLAIDLPGARLVLADTTRPHIHGGTLEAAGEPVVDLVAGEPALVILHHFLHAHHGHFFWPPGIPWSQGRPFLDDLDAAGAGALVTAGHSHRHRRWRHGSVEVTEVGSCKDHPGTWAGYVVHEGGIRQVVRRVARPDCIAWTDYTRRCALGTWALWSPGTLDQRCFTTTW